MQWGFTLNLTVYCIFYSHIFSPLSRLLESKVDFGGIGTWQQQNLLLLPSPKHCLLSLQSQRLLIAPTKYILTISFILVILCSGSCNQRWENGSRNNERLESWGQAKYIKLQISWLLNMKYWKLPEILITLN